MTAVVNPSSMFLPGMAIGGALIASLGAGSTVFLESKAPSAKSLARDFIIGAVMVVLIMQLLPESTSSVIQFLLALAPSTLWAASGGASAQKGGAGGDGGGLSLSDDGMEVKVGVPRF